MRIRSIAVFAIALMCGGSALAQQPSANLSVSADKPGSVYSRYIFAQFAEHLGTGIYDGIWVGTDSSIPNVKGFRSDVIDALKDIKVPMIRWPGGCFADEYHWREGIGPKSERPTKINTNWGGVTESNAFGTHEFLDFTELVGADAYVSLNVGSGTPQEAAEWVEYMTASKGSLADLRAKNGRKQPWKVKVVGIGNELWGCGGAMRPEFAADLTRQYSNFAKSEQRVEHYASGPNIDDVHWTDVLMQSSWSFSGIGLHYYTIPTGDWARKGSSHGFSEGEYVRTLSKTLRMDDLITQHSAVMDKYDPTKRVNLAVDEWGVWLDQEPGSKPGFLYQQNSLRDGILAALNLNIFAKHADRVRQSNIAQMINVLQAMMLTDGPKMVKTPTYYIYKLYLPFQDAKVLPIALTSPDYEVEGTKIPAISAAAVKGNDGLVHVALVNTQATKPIVVRIKIDGLATQKVTGSVLTGPAIDSINTFDDPNKVHLEVFGGAKIENGSLVASLPARSVVMLDLK